MNKNSIFNNIKNEILSKNFMSFFYKSMEHYLINIFIYENNNETCFEFICLSFPSKITSRSTIQSIIKDGLNKNYYNKKINKDDKRQKIISLSEESYNCINIWLKNQKKYWSDL